MTRRSAAGLAALCVVVAVSLVNTHVRGDGNGYFAWIASVVVDGDVNFANQYARGNTLFAERYLADDGTVRPERVTAAGRLENQWAVGPAVLWAPWFLAAHVVVRVTGTPDDDGFALAYRRACAFGTLVYSLCALWCSVQLARAWGVSTRAARTAAAVILGGSSLLVYALLLPFHVHALAAFTVSLFLWYGTSRSGSLAPSAWAVWGGLGGLMAITYYLDAVFLLVAAPVLAAEARRRGLSSAAGSAATFVGAGLLASTPHWLARWYVYGSPLVSGYTDGFNWAAPELWRAAFSTNHGVILWTPVVGLGVSGLLLMAFRRRDVAWCVGAAGVFYVVVASYENWHGLSSFGNRFFVSWTPLVVAGFGVVVDSVWRRRTGAFLVTTLAVALVVWNMGLAFQWASKMVPSRGSVRIGQVVGQQWMVPGRAASYAWRYMNDRAALTREIEEQDQREWHEFRRNQ